MGQSTDAYLYYGMELGESQFWLDDEVPGLEEEELDDYSKVYYTRVHGHPPESYSDEWKWVEAQPIEIRSHCSCDYPMYFVHVKRLFVQAWRGDPKRIDLDYLTTVTLEDADLLRIFCATMNIPWDMDNVGWRLASMWC